MDNPLKEYGKEYFRNLLKNEHPNMKLGDTLTIGIQFLDKEGKVHSTITETSKKEELIEDSKNCDKMVDSFIELWNKTTAKKTGQIASKKEEL